MLLENMFLDTRFETGDVWAIWTRQIRLLATLFPHVSLKTCLPCIHFSTVRTNMHFCSKFTLLLIWLCPASSSKSLMFTSRKFCNSWESEQSVQTWKSILNLSNLSLKAFFFLLPRCSHSWERAPISEHRADLKALLI
jgi:hypothetical protein